MDFNLDIDLLEKIIYTPNNMKEAPKGLANIISQAKESPTYKKRILEEQVRKTCIDILTSHAKSINGIEYVEPVVRRIGSDTVVFKIGDHTVMNNGGSMEETRLEMAVNPTNSYSFNHNEFQTVFTVSMFGVQNKKLTEPTAVELKGYLETLNYLKGELGEKNKNK